MIIFFIDDHNLFFAVGDISGKGIPAALYMTTTKLLIKKYALKKIPPQNIIYEVNNTLTLDNKTFMYSTVLCGILNTQNGELVFCNAGHTAPILYSNSTCKFLPVKENFLVGLKSNHIYEADKFVMNKGDVVILYSDGVIDARNSKNEFFTEEALLNVIKVSGTSDQQEIVKNLTDNVLKFIEGSELYDDVTILALHNR